MNSSKLKKDEKDFPFNSKNKSFEENTINHNYEVSNTKNKEIPNNNHGNTLHFEGKADFEQAINEAFSDFDKDHTGFISKEELGNFMRNLGYKVTDIELEEMINEIDEDGNGFIGLKEFRNILTKSIKDEFSINTSIEAFAIFDQTKTDKINQGVLKKILLEDYTGETKNEKEQEIEDLFNSLNIDKNGNINYRDLVKNCFDIFNTEDTI